MKPKRTVVVASLEEMCDLMCGAPEEHQYCLRCGRKLKTDEARAIGYGKVCLEKLKHDKKMKSLF